MKNPIFRAVENRAHGVLPIGLVEFGAGSLAASVCAAAGWGFFGLVVGGVVVGGLLAWRRVDSDRSDYMQASFRIVTGATRAYGAWETRDMSGSAGRSDSQ